LYNQECIKQTKITGVVGDNNWIASY